MRHNWKFAALLVVASLSMTTAAVAQPLGTFTWQLQPYCNRLTLNVTAAAGGVFTLDGFDDQCGAATRASASGVAFQNPDGTIGLGIVVLMTPGATPEHIDAKVSLPSASGTWVGSAGVVATFALGQNTGGPARPNATNRMQLTRYQGFPEAQLRRANGTQAAPEPIVEGETLGHVSAHGWTGTTFGSGAWISFNSAGNWSPTARGASINFYTTPEGETASSFQMTIDDHGQVGIGTTSPLDQLHVLGNVRVGASGTNGCIKNNNGGTLVGVCVSDARFKRDITPYTPMLERVTALRPVRFSWRAGEFADRGFGGAREDGLIAQDVEAVLPELVTTDAHGYKAVNYSTLPLLAIQAIKELKEKNDALEQEVTAIRIALTELAAAVKNDRR